MNADILQGKWHQLKGGVKARWGKLTDDDIEKVSGNVEQLVGLVQERYGYARDRAEQEVRDFESDSEAQPVAAERRTRQS